MVLGITKNHNKKSITFRKKHHKKRKSITFRKKRDLNKFKTANCHPSIKKNKKNILNHSCLTPQALELLKKTFNNHNTDKKIETNDPNQIWNHLYNEIPECDQETCWLNYIQDKPLQNKLKSELFTPFQPAEWKKNKNAWLSNYDIKAVLKQYTDTYKPDFIALGPTPIDFDSKKSDGQCVWDEICNLSLSREYNKGVRKIGIVYNLDTSEGLGTHWVSMFIDLSPSTSLENRLKKEEEDPFIFYFNSTSEDMPIQIHDLIERLQIQWTEFKGKPLQIYKNTNVKHQRSNTECGMYSLFFVITCLTRKTDLIPDKILSTSDLVELFASKDRIDDKYIEKFREIYFNTSILS
jgi:hypothetical protein